MDKPLMAQALANSVGATKRQIQIWTDVFVLLCQPGTDRRGRGRQRLYDPSEKIFAAFAAALANQGLPIAMLQIAVTTVRGVAGYPGGLRNIEYIPGIHEPDWYTRALAGKVESYICVESILHASRNEPIDIPKGKWWGGGGSITWGTKAEMFEFLKKAPASTIVNVRHVMASIT